MKMLTTDDVYRLVRAGLEDSEASHFLLVEDWMDLSITDHRTWRFPTKASAQAALEMMGLSAESRVFKLGPIE